MEWKGNEVGAMSGAEGNRVEPAIPEGYYWPDPHPEER